MTWTRLRLEALTFSLATLVCSAAPVAAGDSPWFARGKFGQATAEAELGEPVFGRRIDDDDGTAAVEVGYRFGSHLAIQAGYHDYGEYEGLVFPCSPGDICPEVGPDIPFELATVELTGVSLSLVPRLPLGERLSVFGEVGMVDWDADLVSDVGGRDLGGFDDRDVLVGIGVGYDLPSGLGLQLEAEGFDLDLIAWTAGIGWRF